MKLPRELASSSSLGAYSVGTSSIENLVVIDTKDPFTQDEFRNDKTLALITKDSLVYVKNSSIVIQPIGPSVSFVANRNTVASFMGNVQPYFKFLDLIVAILVPIGVFGGMLFRLLYLFLLALLIWAFTGIRKIPGGYGQAYRWGLHLMTLPLILTTFVWLVFPGANVPFLFTVIALIMTGVNVRNLPAATSSAPAQPTS